LLEGGMFKWISLSVIGVILLGLHLTNMYLTEVIASHNHDNASFLAAEYKAKPSATTQTIRAKTALCVTDEVGESIPALNKLFGELVVYVVKNIDKDESTFYQGFLKMMSGQERNMMAIANETSPARNKAIWEMIRKFQEKPFVLMSCVAGKMKKPTTA
jgi:hypothetical protein